MNYYHVWVASTSYRRAEPLTYSHDQNLERGTLVTVPLQNKMVMGVVEKNTTKPAFAVRSIQAIVNTEALPESLLELIDWMSQYYPASRGSTLLACLPSSLTIKPRKREDKTGLENNRPKKLPQLTIEQERAVSAVINAPASSILLHGETGSGKTRVYIEVAKNSFTRGLSVLVLTPEIGLTAQLADTFKATFGSQVAVFHSQLTPAERRDIWLEILQADEPMIVIGARSALFTPIKKLGLIIMDEAHETAYKQEQAPYYQTSRVAAKLANFHKAHFIMGTATPLVADYYLYEQKNLPIIRLSEQAIKDATPPEIRTISLGSREYFTRSVYLADALHAAIEDALKAREQSLIFLNRRGSARVVLCQQCGWHALCPHCDTALTYHGDHHEMRCHICGYKESAPVNCPLCSNPDVTFRAVGTKTIVSELASLFPNARIKRFDTDNLKHERLENVYQDVRDGEVDILVGTQLLGKGLDLPKLSVVGVIQADTSLLIPDYTADEVTYQQLVQIIGRVGRGHRAGKVFIQSHNPDNLAIQAAIKRDYRLFYNAQLEERQSYRFPPFAYILKLSCYRSTSKSAEQAAQKLKRTLETLQLPIEIIGPSPAFHEKKSNQYYWQLILKARQRSALLEVIKQLPSGWLYDIDPTNLL